jgi:hypothetical protein
MLNGQRMTWSTSTSFGSGGYKTYGKHYHRICPSYKPLSAITNNGFVGISWALLLPAALLITAGVFLTLYVTWLAGVLFFICAATPHLWLIKRYFDSTPFKWEKGSKICAAEDAFLLMPESKQREYKYFLDATFKGNLNAEEARKLFQQFSQVTSIKQKLDEEIKRQNELREIMKSIDPLGG